MTGTDTSAGRTWRYRFSVDDDHELEEQQLGGDEAAEAHGRELSKARQAAVTIKRHNHVDWEYVTEVDERS